MSSGDLRLHTPKNPEHEVVYITDLFENKPKAAMEGGLISCAGNGQKPLKMMPWGFPGGTVFENPSANAGDMSSSPGPGRSHVLQNN